MASTSIRPAGTGLSKGLRIVALVAGLGVPASIANIIQRQHTYALADAETRATNTAHALEEHAARIFENIDTYLRAVASLVGPRTGKLPEGAMHDALREQVGRSRLFNISVIDRDGHALAEASTFPARPLDVKDRAYFRALRDQPGDTLVIGDPIIGRLTGKLLIPVGRRIEGSDGAFAGIIQGMFDPQAFEDVYSTIDNGPGAVLTLWHTDGTLLVRSPPMPAVIGRNYADGENYRQHVAPRDTKSFWSTGSTDGMERVFALGFLDGYPLFVGAALGREDALAAWRRSATTLAAGGGGLTLVLVAALLLLAREIERRLSADASIRLSEERYRLLADNTSDLIVFKPTMTGRRGYVSPAVRTILGWEPEEYAALPSAEIIHPDEMSDMVAIYSALSPERSQATHVHRLRHKAGHYVWIESIFKLVGRDLQDRTVVVSGRDVTARREADEALRVSEARYRLLSGATTDMVTHMDLSGRRLYVSPASRELLGYEPHELLGTSPQQAIHPEDAAGLNELLADMASGRRERGAHVNRLRHRDGHWVWVEASLKRLQDNAGQTTGFVASVRNVDARKADEAALLAAREEAERASAAKSEFLASMSHEIRTPLNGVIGYADLLLDELGIGGRARQCGERIRSAGAALLTVVNDILDFSKIEAGEVEIVARPFSPATLVDNAVSIVRGLAEAKGLALDVDLDPALPVWLAGDEDRLRQVLLNLLNNAIKFTTVGRVALRVTVDAGTDPLRVSVAVIDTGIGIPANKRDRLFQRFSQVDGSYRRGYGGTGLGLAISKSLIELMGGSIGVDSDEGRGSTFWFEVDLHRAQAPRLVPAEAGVTPTRQGRRLLLAEDVPLNQELARTILEGAGHTVDVVADGAEAVRAVQAERYDLVLMDVQMPVMDGMSATRRIRSLGGSASALPIIALTANVLPQQVAEFRDAGMTDHVGKPFRRDALLAVIDRWAGPSAEQVAAADMAGPAHGPRIDLAVLDTMVLTEMKASFGAARFSDMLGLLANELTERLRPNEDDRQQIAYDAHALVSAAGSLGFVGLSKLCHEVETAARAGADLTSLIKCLEEQRATTLRVISELRAA